MKLTRKKSGIRPFHGLRIDIYHLVSHAVENGVTAGWYRAHKHTDKPNPEFIKCEIESAIMSELSNVFIWPERYSEE